MHVDHEFVHATCLRIRSVVTVARGDDGDLLSGSVLGDHLLSSQNCETRTPLGDME